MVVGCRLRYGGATQSPSGNGTSRLCGLDPGGGRLSGCCTPSFRKQIWIDQVASRSQTRFACDVPVRVTRAAEQASHGPFPLTSAASVPASVEASNAVSHAAPWNG